LPPLRERFDELVPLARTFLEQACRRTGRDDVPQISHEALQRLHSYSWPGNIRELRNTIERAVLLCGRGPIALAHLPTEKMAATLPAVAPRASEAAREMPTPPPRPADSAAGARPPLATPMSMPVPLPLPAAAPTPTPTPTPRDLASPGASTAAPTVFDSSESTRPFTRVDADEGPSALGDQIDALERQRILETLEQCGGNQTR